MIFMCILKTVSSEPTFMMTMVSKESLRMLRWIQLSLVLEGMREFPGRFAASFLHVLWSFQRFLTSWLLLCVLCGNRREDLFGFWKWVVIIRRNANVVILGHAAPKI